MTGRSKSAVWIISIGVVSICIVFLTSAVWFFVAPRPRPPQWISITGVVLAKDRDPRKQVAVSNATISVRADQQSFETQSDSSGLFRLSLPPPPKENPIISFMFQAAGYQPLLIPRVATDRILVARMLPETDMPSTQDNQTVTTISGVSVRYTTRTITNLNIGALGETFEAINTGGLACAGSKDCSPDGKWKATISSAVFQAGTGNQFLNARMSCIAGPCPFTRIEADNLSNPGSTIRVSVRNWSDTATFLVEAEVSRMVHGDMVRQSIPAIFGPTLSFTLPPGSEGPSIQAEVNGTTIVFPLGPEYRLSWANCTVQMEKTGTRVFRCELKPGYRFPQP